MCCFFKKKKIKPFVPAALDRIKEFFIYCEGLEQHPFFKAHKHGARFELKCEITEFGEDIAVLNFDEFHLESFLTRLRQFYFENELFYIKELRRAVKEVFGISDDFQRYYDKFFYVSTKSFPKSNVSAYKSNGKDIIAGYNFSELIEARLYTGAIHSTHRIDPAAKDVVQGVANAHLTVSKHLTFVLAGRSVEAAQNIFSFRRRILQLARENDKTNLFEQLVAFDQRVAS